MQQDLFPAHSPVCVVDFDGRVMLHRQWLTHEVAAALFCQLKDRLAGQQTVLSLYGKRMPIPRLNAWYGDRGSGYSYSGAHFSPQPWTPELQDLRSRLESFCEKRFNSVLANLYRDGKDSVAWHSDNEPELGPEPYIASLSLGAPRRFCLRHIATGRTSAIELAAGDLLLMSGQLQACWQHQVPKSRRSVGPRINLTFRHVFS